MDGSDPDPPRPFGASRWLATLAAGALRLLGATWRLEIRGLDPFAAGAAAAPVLGALLHRDLLIAAWCFRDRGIHVGVSRSRDGDLVDAVLARLGYGASVRGSSSRGGAMAQRALLGRLRQGGHVAVVVDGPRGPAGHPKPGVAWLAVESGRPIVAVRYRARFAWRFGSWDRAWLPLPFAKVECRFGAALHVKADERETALELLSAELRDA